MELEQKSDLLYAWMLFAVSSLVFAGVFAFLAAMTRTPVVRLLPSANYFQISLVAHVIFSIVVWFLGFMGALWIFTAKQANLKLNESLAWSGFFAAVAGIALIATASLFGLGSPVLIDYVPLLESRAYFLGLGLLALGVTVAILSFILSARKSSASLPIAAAGMLYAGIVTIAAFLTVPIAAIFVGVADYRNLFWGPGHVIQFANTLSMAVAWFLLAEIALKKSFNESAVKKLVILYLIFALALPFVYLTPAQNQARLFTLGMGYGLGIPSFFIALMILKAVLESILERGFVKLPWRDPGFSSLALSLALFGAGGLIGATDPLGNTRVPAHYHASLGAVTVAFMGLTYHLLPEVKRRVHSERVASWQPYLYGLGLLMLISGLFWAGMYNAPRKAYAMGYEEPALFIAMNLMGIGAVIAVIGGAAFVANALLPLLRKPEDK